MAVPGKKQIQIWFLHGKLLNTKDPNSSQLVKVFFSFDNDNLHENQLQSCFEFIAEPANYCTKNKDFLLLNWS